MTTDNKLIIKNHLIRLTLASIISLPIFYMIFYYSPQWYFKTFPIMFILQVATYYFADLFFLNNILKKGKNFLLQHKINTILKFFIQLIILTIIIFIEREKAIQVAISFLSIFFLFLIIQTISFYKIFKNK